MKTTLTLTDWTFQLKKWDETMEEFITAVVELYGTTMEASVSIGNAELVKKLHSLVTKEIYLSIKKND